MAVGSSFAAAAPPEELLLELDNFPHARSIKFEEKDVIDYEIGLGARQKTRGAWKFKSSERQSGRLLSYSWQIMDGFTSIEVMDDLLAKLQENEQASELFSCDGRACGHGSQWANQVFNQRVLYGREELQRYRVYGINEGATEYRLIVYSASRTAERQYLHVELLRIADQ